MVRLTCTVIVLLLLMAVSGVPADSTSAAVDSSRAVDTISAATTTQTQGESQSVVYPLSPERKAKLIAYSRFTNIWRFAGFLISILIPAIILFTGFSARMRNWAKVARKRFFVVWLFLILYLVADYLLNFPFDFYRSFLVEKDFGFMNQTFGGWFWDSIKTLLIGMVIGIVPMWFFYWLIERFKRWWLIFSVGAVPFLVFFIVVAPVVISPLFNKFEPLKNKTLESQILAEADKAGIQGSHVFEVNASKQSDKINAYVTGLFGTKRIVLYDNLVKNFTPDEIRFVMGHEMGHYVMHHIWYGLLLVIVLLFFCLWLTNKTIHPVIRRFQQRFKFDRLSDIASLPLVFIFVGIISFVIQPISNGFSRYEEHQADIFGLNISGVPGDVAATAFDKLSAYNLSDPDPNALIEFWFYDHPALDARMAFARSYKPRPGDPGYQYTQGGTH
jgi:STE24 endopeptidase